MGCGASKWRDPGVHQRSLSSVGDVVVFLPGLRVPRNIDFSRTLGDHLDKSVVERLTALRSSCGDGDAEISNCPEAKAKGCDAAW